MYAALLVFATLAVSMAGCASSGTMQKPAAANEVQPTAAQELAAGDDAARRGEFERALVHYLRAVEIEPTAAAWLRVGAASTQLGHSERALTAYLQVIDLDPTQAEAHEGAGLEYMALKDFAAAQDQFEQAVQLDPKRWRSHNGLGVIADEADDHESAIAHFETALELNPNSAVLLNNLGFSEYLSDDLDDAARDLYSATEADPTYKRAWSNLALVYAHRGWYADAVRTLSKATDEAKAYNDIGYLAYQRGDLDDAEMLLTEAMRKSPVYFETAHRNLEAVQATRAGQQKDGTARNAETPGLISSDLTPFVADER